MTASFGLAAVLYAVAISVACAARAVSSGRRGPLLTMSVVGLELAALVQAGLDVVQLASGAAPHDLATHLGYLLTSAVAVPAAAGAVHMDEGPWGSAALAVGCLVLAVVSVRLRQTLGSTGG